MGWRADAEFLQSQFQGRSLTLALGVVRVGLRRWAEYRLCSESLVAFRRVAFLSGAGFLADVNNCQQHSSR